MGCRYLAGVAAGFATGVAAVLLVASALLVLFGVLVLFLVAFVLLVLAGTVVLEEVPAGDAALGACAAKVRGMVATAKAIVANNVFFIFSLPAGLIARLQLHLAPDADFHR
jgi:hypothetical protein